MAEFCVEANCVAKEWQRDEKRGNGSEQHGSVMHSGGKA